MPGCPRAGIGARRDSFGGGLGPHFGCALQSGRKAEGECVDACSGARSRVVMGTLWIEFLVLGAMAGSLAAAGTEVAAWALDQVFEMWAPTPALWWIGPSTGALIVGTLGVWSCRRVVRTPPVTLLREV